MGLSDPEIVDNPLLVWNLQSYYCGFQLPIQGLEVSTCSVIGGPGSDSISKEPEEQKKGFWANFRHFFFRGLAAILPSLLTLVLVVKGYQFISQYVGGYVNWMLIRIVAWAQALMSGDSFKERVSNMEVAWQHWYLQI